MIDLSKLKKKEETQIVACRVPKKYLHKLKKSGIGTSDFILACFKEQFD